MSFTLLHGQHANFTHAITQLIEVTGAGIELPYQNIKNSKLRIRFLGPSAQGKGLK